MTVCHYCVHSFHTNMFAKLETINSFVTVPVDVCVWEKERHRQT